MTPRCAVGRLRAQLAGRAPVICGKGPSLDPAAVAASGHAALTLNHACRVVPAVLACFVDLEAMVQCDPDGDVVLPWVPNVNFKPAQPLDVLLESRAWPALARAWWDERLYCYNRAGTWPAHAGLRTIAARYFSAEAAFGLAVAAGAKMVYTSGVDGGSDYSSLFDPKDRLANGRKSFDVQFEPIRTLLRRNRAVWLAMGAAHASVNNRRRDPL